MATTSYELKWADLAFGNKSALRESRAIFIAAPRQISPKRFAQLVKTNLPKADVILGIADEAYVEGFEGQPQFRTLRLDDTLRSTISKINAASPSRKLTVLHYAQRDLQYVLDKGDFARVLFVNGSWQHSFHYRPEYYTLANKQVPFELVSAFADEAEAREYASFLQQEAHLPKRLCSDTEMMELAADEARNSFDYTFQTGVALGRPYHERYIPLLTAHNAVVPYATYAMLHGSSRERNFAPMNDANYYDTSHAEMMLLTKAVQHEVNIAGTSVFLNLMPCPSCARMLAATDIGEVVYCFDHSKGYALTMLEQAGKRVRRLVINGEKE